MSHELDEFMMVEKPLTHHKRKKAANPEKMKPEMRQLEEQFTVYDCLRGSRMSYYPHNQPLVNNVAHGDDDEEPAPVVQSATNTLLPTATIVDRSTAGSPTPDQQPQAPRAPPAAVTRASTAHSRTSTAPSRTSMAPPRTSNAPSRTSRSS